MGRPLRSIFVSLAFLVGSMQALHAQGAGSLERGVAITDPAALQELDRGRLGLAGMLASSSPETSLTDQALFALPSMAHLKKSLDDEFERYVQRHAAEFPGQSIGVGSSFDFQLFDRAELSSPTTQFVLAGIVNRMDRAYARPGDCGEIRLIYRLTKIDAPLVGDHQASARLPMTLNLVLKARADQDAGITCAEIARRWLTAADWKLTGQALAEKLSSADAPLDLVRPDHIRTIETNLQIVHVAQSQSSEFRTDYLLKVFDYQPETLAFEEAALENQIDRDRIMTDDRLRRDFKAWLLDPDHFGELDRGTILIPEKFLAKGAVAPTPIGFSPSALQPAFGFVQGEGGRPLFAGDDVVGALQKAAARGIHLQNIRSMSGFERRLNDITCTGCHQTRGIGGFHFPGVDWMAAHPSNSTIVPASPHFFGDQVRRRTILAAIRDGKPVDYSRGFSERPQLRGSSELGGTEYEDGWGAHCYAPVGKASDNDRSYASWICAKGLSCQIMSETSRMGMCFVGKR